MKKVAAIVVTYNRKKLLLENIKALLAQTYRNLDILLLIIVVLMLLKILFKNI